MSRLMWATKRTQRSRPVKPPPESAPPPPQRADAPGLTPAAAGIALKHMHHVLGALRQTMLLESLYTAGAELEGALAQAASAAAAGDAAPHGSCASVDELLQLHSAHLDAVERALWLSGERSVQVRTTLPAQKWPPPRRPVVTTGGSVQVVARKIYELLDTALGFCAAATKALAPAVGAPADERSAQARLRAAGSKAAQLARAFQDVAADLVAVLCSKEIQVAAGSQATRLLDTLNFNSFYEPGA